MGMLICNRCEAYKDSKDGDTVVDPTDDMESVCETCLTEEELFEEGTETPILTGMKAPKPIPGKFVRTGGIVRFVPEVSSE